MKISLDVDSVLANVIITWINIYQKLYKVNSKINIDTWDFWKNLQLTRKQFEEIFTEAWRQWKQIPATETSISSKVNNIQKLGNIDIVTGRTKKTIPQVKKWLKFHNIKYENFVHVQLTSLKKELDYDVFIDDSPYTAVGVAENNRYCLLYDQPWNRHIQNHPRLVRIKNLSEVTQIIKTLFF